MVDWALQGILMEQTKIWTAASHLLNCHHSFGFGDRCMDFFFLKYSLTTARATSTTSPSSTVAGTLTAFSYSPLLPFSTNSRNTLRSVLPDLVLGIIPRPWMMPPRLAIEPICSLTSLLTEWKSSGGGLAASLPVSADDDGDTNANGR
jgi:hypothetical protein